MHIVQRTQSLNHCINAGLSFQITSNFEQMNKLSNELTRTSAFEADKAVVMKNRKINDKKACRLSLEITLKRSLRFVCQWLVLEYL